MICAMFKLKKELSLKLGDNYQVNLLYVGSDYVYLPFTQFIVSVFVSYLTAKRTIQK